MPEATNSRLRQPHLETARCIVRPALPTDLATLLAAVQSPLFPRRLPLAQMAMSDELAPWLARMCSRSSEGSAFLWSIELRDEARCIGQISLSPRPGSTSWALAFWLDPTHWGRGIAAEAVSRVNDAAFSLLSMQELWAGVALWNQRSFTTLERLGFRLLGVHSSGYWVAGEPEPIRGYHLTRQRWLDNERLHNG